jgi:TonB family protein
VALAGEYPSSVDAKEAAFLLAYADVMVAKSKRNLEAFNLATKPIDNGGWGDFLLARAYADGAKIALDIDMPRIGRDLVDRGLAETTRLAPGNNGVRTNLLVLRTQSSLQLRQFGQAVAEAMEARRSYGVPKSERDLNWAALAAWEAAGRAVYTSVMGQQMGTATRIAKPGSMPDWTKEELASLSGQPPECVGLEMKRLGRPGPQGISFPAQEQRDMYAGGAYVRAHLDSDGKVINADLLSALPRPAFGEAALQGIRNWQYDIPVGTPQQCRYVDVVVMYAFQ